MQWRNLKQRERDTTSRLYSDFFNTSCRRKSRGKICRHKWRPKWRKDGYCTKYADERIRFENCVRTHRTVNRRGVGAEINEVQLYGLHSWVSQIYWWNLFPDINPVTPAEFSDRGVFYIMRGKCLYAFRPWDKSVFKSGWLNSPEGTAPEMQNAPNRGRRRRSAGGAWIPEGN